jgi:hypothetical protein
MAGAAGAPSSSPQLEITTSRQFGAWLDEQKISLAFTTYQAGKLFLVGLQPNGRLSIFEPLTFCPGFLRGLSFLGDYAVVATSQPRENKTFTGLALDDKLAERGAQARCQLAVIDLRTFDLVHWLRIEGVVEELYDVVVLPGVRRPSALGFKTDEIRRTLSIAQEEPL